MLDITRSLRRSSLSKVFHSWRALVAIQFLFCGCLQTSEANTIPSDGEMAHIFRYNRHIGIPTRLHKISGNQTVVAEMLSWSRKI